MTDVDWRERALRAERERDEALKAYAATWALLDEMADEERGIHDLEASWLYTEQPEDVWNALRAAGIAPARLRALLEPGQCEAQKPAAVGDVYEVPGVPVYWTITKADDRYVSAESEDGSYIGRRMPWTPPPDWRLVRTGPR